jgi:iron complex outermembrane receptor protein
MSLRHILLFICLLFVKISFAQQADISGKVTDEKDEPLPGVVSELRRESDSVLVKVNVTDTDGKFIFQNISAGKYYIKTSMIGFEMHKSPVFEFDGNAARQITVVKLKTSAVNLKEAQVTAIRPLVEVHADKTVFNVENSINSTGNTAYELLKKAPGVVVDNNDNISLKGKGGVLVQIDGKDMHMSQEELGDYLKTIQSVDVEAIDLISNPSSKYEAEGTAGIVNIRLKKNKNYGMNGTISAGTSIADFAKYNTSISINNRSKQLNIFSNYSNNWGKRRNEFYLYREQYPYIFDAASFYTRWGLNNNYKAGADYTLNSKNTIGVMAYGNYSDINGTNESQTDIHNFDTYELDSVLSSNQETDGFGNNTDINLNHRFADTLGHELTTDADYAFYNSKRNTYQPNIYTLPDGETLLNDFYNRSITYTKIKISTLKTDYSQKLFSGTLAIGYKLSFVNTDNTFDYYNISGSEETIDQAKSNHFVYDENVYAGYFNFQQKVKKFDIQAGLRMELTSSEGDLKNAADSIKDSNVKRSYTDFFPSGGITYNMNQSNAFALIYSRRIDRPNYQELNPFEMKLDELSYRKGNPFLNPQYSHKIDLSHTYKYTTTTGVGYSYTSDYFAQITDTIPGGKSYITSKNLATEEIWSVYISTSLDLTKWWGIYTSWGYYIKSYKADFGGGKRLNSTTTPLNGFLQNNFKLPKDYSIELSGWFNTGGVWGGAYVTDAQGSLDIGLQKKLMKGQATLKLSYSDILNTAPFYSHNVYAGIKIEAHGTWESQQFRATFTWRFGNRQMKNSRTRQTGSEEEQNRIGGE